MKNIWKRIPSRRKFALQMHSRPLLVVFLLFVGSGCGGKPDDDKVPTSTPSTDSLAENVNAIIRPVVDYGWARAVMVGTVKDGREDYFGFGSVSNEEVQLPDADTVFEIGSVTKVFTAILLADMAARGEVALADPVSKHLPADLRVPAPGGRPITLADLASHTSGLPNIPANFWMKGDDIYDPNTSGRRWADYSPAQLAAYFADPQPPVQDARTFTYSNLGTGLLGHALGRAAGQPVERLIASRICEVLAMKSTGTDVALSTRGHDADGNQVEPWLLGNSMLGGAFALRSSARDLIRLARANLGDGAGTLAGALAESHQVRGEINQTERTALGWRVNVNGVLYTTGATGGFRCALSIHPPTRSAVVILANTQMGGVTGGRAALFDALAGSLLNALAGAPPIRVPIPEIVAAPVTVTDYPGTYEPVPAGAGPTLNIRLNDGRLETTGPNERPLILWPTGGDGFLMREHNGELSFERDPQGKVTGARVNFEGHQARLQRVNR